MVLKPCSFYNKRGVSPLIATVLLISFAVALGSVVLNWGATLGPNSDDKCSGINIKIRTLEDYEACYSGSGSSGYINFIIDNDGNKNVEGLGIWIVGEKDTKLWNFDDITIIKGELFPVEDQTVGYDFDTYGPITNIQFFPKVLSEGKLDFCAKNSVKAEKIGRC